MTQSEDNISHIPVMLEEVISHLVTDVNGFYIDCTFGMGGHTKELLTKLSPNASVIGIDLDKKSEKEALTLSIKDTRFNFLKINFKNLLEHWQSKKMPMANGILFDLGYSTEQLNDPKQGFSYSSSDELNMNIDPENKKTASYILNTYSKKNLYEIFKVYADFKNPKKLVDVISEYRKHQEIATCEDCLKIIEHALPVNKFQFNKHPAKLFFQALRIETNNELENLQTALNFLDKILLPNGVALFLTFNSLEEKVLKKWIGKNCYSIVIPDYVQNVESKFKLLDNKFLIPSQQEIYKNWSSRSAKLWVFQKTV